MEINNFESVCSLISSKLVPMGGKELLATYLISSVAEICPLGMLGHIF